MRTWHAPAALAALLALAPLGCGKPDPTFAAAPMVEAHNFDYQAFLCAGSEGQWHLKVTFPSELNGPYTGVLEGDRIPVAVRPASLTDGPIATWTFDRDRWAGGAPFRLRLKGTQSILLEVRLPGKVGGAEGLRLAFLERH
jgi:hypothetical protein